MQQHPVPQNVTQYQFRLVGDMTLKQFLELLGGLVVAYLFFSSNLIFIFKWPLAGASLLLGFGLAFFPIEDRPLDQWIINFVRSIYAPTRYIWKKSNKVPGVFTFEAHPIIETVTATKTVKAPILSDLQPKAVSDISDEERQRFNVLDAMLAKAAPSAPPVAKPTVTINLDKPAVTVHKLKPLAKVGNNTVFQSAPRPAPIAVKKISLDSDSVLVPATAPTSISSFNAPSNNQEIKKSVPNLIFSKPTVTHSQVSVAPSTPASIKLPASPSSPNLVVGMVVDKNDKIVENAIVQIVTQEGIPARAIKTNSLGQFHTSTPLSKGIYTIETEKDGITFPSNKLAIEDKVISPLLIKANG